MSNKLCHVYNIIEHSEGPTESSVAVSLSRFVQRAGD